MAKRNKYRSKFLRWHKTYEKRALKEFKKVFTSWVESIDWSVITYGNYMEHIGETFDEQLLKDAYVKVYTDIGKVHGVRVGKGINMQMKSFNINSFLLKFEEDVIAFLMRFAGTKIVTVKKSFIKTVMKFIKEAFEKEYDLFDAAESLHEELLFNKKMQNSLNIDKMYGWQALRIARTETTAAANYAALQAADISGYAMVKEWISAVDDRTREHEKGDEYDHVDMDGVKVSLHSKFIMNDGDDELEYPGDPTGEAGNIINCRCTVAAIPARDINGNLIPIR